MRKARIYRMSKPAVQSGRARTKEWILELERTERKRADPLIGWLGSSDTGQQVKLEFASEAEAVAHAERMGWRAEVAKPRERRIVPKSYADNFLR